MANIQKHLVYSIHTPATQAWKETPESSQEKHPTRASTGDFRTNQLGFKAGKFVAACLTAMACHFSCQSPRSSSPPPRREVVLELKTCFLWLSPIQVKMMKAIGNCIKERGCASPSASPMLRHSSAFSDGAEPPQLAFTSEINPSWASDKAHQDI